MELNDFILSVLIGIGAGFAIIVFYAVYLYHKITIRLDKIIQAAVAEAEVNMIGLDIETENDVYFCYNSKDKTFICQGATVGEIAVAFRHRYPDKIAYLAGGDETVVAKFKEELLKFKLETDEASRSQ